MPPQRPRRRLLIRAAQQAAIVLAALALVLWFALSVRAGLARNGIGFDLGFLLQPAGFDISEGQVWAQQGLRAFQSGDSNAQALLAGFGNTLKVALLAIALSTVFGTLLGLGRLSHNWLVQRLCFGLVEFVRNTPMLIQLVFWYFAVVLKLPALDEAIQAFGFLLSQKGLFMPALSFDGGMALSWPQVQGFGVVGGWGASPEFAALLLGLTVYTAAFIAEIVRGAIQALPKGQWEAAQALGMSRAGTFRDVVVPQVFRVVLPAFGNQYISLAKSTSLGIAIGFPDLFNVYGTVANQSGRSLEGVIVVMGAYLLLSWLISAATNAVNARLLKTGGAR